ncbi:unnamed protein product [Discosporangium mesarthrocarpum]
MSFAVLPGNLTLPPEACTLEEALRSPEHKERSAAMVHDLGGLEDVGVLEQVQRPEGKRVIGVRCLFKRKVMADDIVILHDAHLIARCYLMVTGLDYLENFGPTPLVASSCLLLAVHSCPTHGARAHRHQASLRKCGDGGGHLYWASCWGSCFPRWSGEAQEIIIGDSPGLPQLASIASRMEEARLSTK